MHYYFYKQILKADKISFISRSIKYLKEVHNFFTLYRSNNLGFFFIYLSWAKYSEYSADKENIRFKNIFHFEDQRFMYRSIYWNAMLFQNVTLMPELHPLFNYLFQIEISEWMSMWMHTHAWISVCVFFFMSAV